MFRYCRIFGCDFNTVYCIERLARRCSLMIVVIQQTVPVDILIYNYTETQAFHRSERVM